MVTGLLIWPEYTLSTGVPVEKRCTGSLEILGTSAQGADDLTLRVSERETQTDDYLCVDIEVDAFEEIIAMQYSVQWDPAILHFEEVTNMGLPGLGEPNFGLHLKDEGLMTFVWLDNTLNGVSVPDGSSIYQLCFEVKGPAGTETDITFVQRPTPFEAVDVRENVLEIRGESGTVYIR
jgi:hypothetical protein